MMPHLFPTPGAEQPTTCPAAKTALTSGECHGLGFPAQGLLSWSGSVLEVCTDHFGG